MQIEHQGAWWFRDPVGAIFYWNPPTQSWMPWTQGMSGAQPPAEWLMPPPPAYALTPPQPYARSPYVQPVVVAPRGSRLSAKSILVAVVILLVVGTIAYAAGSGADDEPLATQSVVTPTLSESSLVPTPTPADVRIETLVVRVIDGDTIEVDLEGIITDIRLIGVDTPEPVHPRQPDECLGREASRFTTRKLNGRLVELEFDVERLDRYGRTLAYVWVGNAMFNEVLVEQGFAQVSTYPPNVKYEKRFTAAQRNARAGQRGLWGDLCVRPEPPPVPVVDPEPEEPAGNCHPAYPDVCIPPAPPDLDCDDVAYSAFRVTQHPDPHGFDGDSDGVGCE